MLWYKTRVYWFEIFSQVSDVAHGPLIFHNTVTENFHRVQGAKWSKQSWTIAVFRAIYIFCKCMLKVMKKDATHTPSLAEE